MYEGINLAVLGCGKWGINHIRTAFEILGDKLIAVCDINKDKASRIIKYLICFSVFIISFHLFFNSSIDS